MKLEAKTFMPSFSLLAFQPPSLYPIVALADGLMLVFQHPVSAYSLSYTKTQKRQPPIPNRFDKPPQRAINCFMNIRVECYCGHRGDETPQAVWIGERRIAVAELLDRWLAPDHRYFKFRGDDQGIYIIRNDVVSLTWQITFYQDPKMEPGPVRGPVGGSA